MLGQCSTHAHGSALSGSTQASDIGSSCLDAVVEAGDSVRVLWLNLDLDVGAAGFWGLCELLHSVRTVLDGRVALSAVSSKQILCQGSLAHAGLPNLLRGTLIRSRENKPFPICTWVSSLLFGSMNESQHAQPPASMQSKIQPAHQAEQICWRLSCWETCTPSSSKPWHSACWL